MEHDPLLSDDYLLARWERDYKAYLDSGEDASLLKRLHTWHGRDPKLTETKLEAQFVELFFKQTWGYWGTGEREAADGYCLSAQYGVDGAGEGGGRGAADLALGWWGLPESPSVPQVLCEFKDVRSGLDAPQRRKSNDRSPVKQCFDYLKHAFDATPSGSMTMPTWGIVTNMNEFRLYARRVGDSRQQRFYVRSPETAIASLLDGSDAAAFQRFLFKTSFHRNSLLAHSGKSRLQRVLEEQWIREKELEKDFYREYQGYREAVFAAIQSANPGHKATRGTLVRLTQRFLDRCIFVLFCEDMGQALDFPNDLLRDLLIHRSKDAYYDPDGTEIWTLIKRLFGAMRNGGPFPPKHKINRFNGGLFEEAPDLEALVIPNRVFCTQGQGESPQTLSATPKTLLYLAANYNFGAKGTTHERTITLYALGRIFEQSITDLEYMEAEAEGKDSLASITKRKRDGVYYTPEWVTDYIVRETVGTRLADLRRELGLELGEVIPEEDLRDYRDFLNHKRRKKTPKNAASRAVGKIDRYEESLSALKVLDPACGSGAFLIQALRYLMGERRTLAEERARITGGHSLFDYDANIRAILSGNLYGVDINPESVEITQLALWLNTALPGRPLSNLDAHIRCGNSLVGPRFAEFYQSRHTDLLFADLDPQAKEDVNVFSWEEAFPEVLGEGVPLDKRGFDCVIGNPPYVKLQHFRKLKPEESDYYIDGTTANGEPIYESAQTGSFDLYAPFIERGISLLNPGGRMGYIAPSAWLVSEYGAGLRQLVRREQCLDRWIDFKSFQVFDEATTYTALQFFCGRPTQAVRFFIAPDGDIAPLDWDDDVESIQHPDLPKEDAWHLHERGARELIRRLANECESLGEFSAGIAVGIQTSADRIYHLRRIAPGRYCSKSSNTDDLAVEIEDGIMRPLVSGPEAKRFVRPETAVYLLFPYVVEDLQSRLLTEQELSRSYPKAWAYLESHEEDLRARENRKMDRDESWWGYNYPKNLAKQELPKLGVAETVPGMRVFADPNGKFYLNNVRVNAVLPAKSGDLFFLLGVLNSRVVEFVFKRTAKPKGGGYFEANKQYIAPLPIPTASKDERVEIAEAATNLDALHTQRRDKTQQLRRRLESAHCTDDVKSEEWLWADVKTLAEWRACAPEDLPARQRTVWAKTQRGDRIAAHLAEADAVLSPNAVLGVEQTCGEIRLRASGISLATAYVDETLAPFIAAQWRQVARTTNITAKFEGKTLVKALRALVSTRNVPLREQVVKLDEEIQDIDLEITTSEAHLNGRLYALYKLTDDEVRLVDGD